MQTRRTSRQAASFPRPGTAGQRSGLLAGTWHGGQRSGLLAGTGHSQPEVWPPGRDRALPARGLTSWRGPGTPGQRSGLLAGTGHFQPEVWPPGGDRAPPVRGVASWQGRALPARGLASWQGRALPARGLASWRWPGTSGRRSGLVARAGRFRPEVWPPRNSCQLLILLDDVVAARPGLCPLRTARSTRPGVLVGPVGPRRRPPRPWITSPAPSRTRRHPGGRPANSTA